MKKILNALFLTLLAVFTFSSCSDVPAPYDILGEGDVPGMTGDGTKENPYNIETAQKKQDGSIAWVQGYIVGCVDGEGKTIATESRYEAPFTIASNILIADTPNETNYKNCIPVQLVGGSDVRVALNLKDNAGNLSKVVMIYGSLEKYFGVAGLKAATAAVLDGAEIGEGGSGQPSGSLVELLDATNPVNQVVNTFDDAENDKEYVKEGYVNFAEEGGRTWRGKPYNNNGLIQATAYGSKEPSVVSWFVTPAVNTAQMKVKKVTFDCISAYYKEGNKLEVYFLEKEGNELKSKLLDVGTLPQNANGYSEAKTETLTADLTSIGDKVGFIGFKYVGSETMTGTYQIDNLYVGVEPGEGPEPGPKPEENAVFVETFGATVSSNTNVADFKGWDNGNLKFTVANAKCNIRAKAHMTDANRTEQTKVNSIWFPAKYDHTFTISGIDASKYNKFIVKYELGANVYNAGSSIDLNVLKVSLNDAEVTAASKVVSKDNNDANVFFDMQVEISVQGTANSTLKFSATGADNTMGLLLYNVRLIGVVGGDEEPKPGEADGTEAHPYSVADVINLNNTQKGPYYVKAYIIGTANGAMDKIQTSDFSGDTNIVIADKQGETEVSKLVPVKLPSGAIRTAWGLKTNPDKLGKQVVIQANLEKYFNVPGLKSPTSIIEVVK